MEKNKDEVGVKGKIVKVEHKNIYAALSAFQGELEPIEQSARVNFKTKSGEVIDFTYAPLNAIMKVIYPLLAKNGLSVRHELGENWVECILTHETSLTHDPKYATVPPKNEDGTYEIPQTIRAKDFTSIELRSGKLLIDTKKSEMKDVGGQITYARRYTLGIVLGLSTEEDKDTTIFEQNRENTEAFAMKQVRNTIEKTKKEDLDKQVDFLNKELELAEALENGTGKKAPSLGLSSKQYKELITLAKGRKGVAPAEEDITINDNPADEPAK